MFLLLEKAHAGAVFKLEDILASIPWDSHGLIAAIAQQYDTGEVLMLAWMNQQALDETLLTGRACYWSRSRSCLLTKRVRPPAAFSKYMISVWIVTEMRYYCLWIKKVEPATQVWRSCFYNAIKGDELTVLNDPG